MTLESVLDKRACSGISGVNTGKLGCLSLLGTPTHFILTPKGFVIPKETTFDLDYITEQVQKGKFIPLIDASGFEDLSAEDAYSTNSSGIKRLNLKGLAEFKFMFEEGHEFYREISKLTSYKSYEVILIDDMNNIVFAKNSAGDLKGFQLGHVTTERLKNKVKGGDAESKSIVMQLLNRDELDMNYGILHAESIEFTAQDIPLVNGANIIFDSIPTVASTTINVKVVLSQDNNTPVEGLIAANFNAKVNGETVVVSAAVESEAGLYALTVPALALNDVTEVDLFDGTLNVHTILSGGVLFRADAVTETVVAA